MRNLEAPLVLAYVVTRRMQMVNARSAKAVSAPDARGWFIVSPAGCRRSRLRIWCFALTRQRSRESEPREHAVLKTRQSTDSIAGEGKNEEANAMTHAVRGSHVCAERRLAIGTRRDEVEVPA